MIQQAAAASGVATPILRQMMPMIAGMVVAGIVHLMLNQTQAAPAPQAPAAGTTPYGFSPAAYWSEMMKSWTAGSTPPAPAERPLPRRTGVSPALMAPPPPSAVAQTTPYDVVQQMFQAGVEAQQENVKAMQKLFDAFWTSPQLPSPDPAGRRS